jgi:hypothetical protein
MSNLHCFAVRVLCVSLVGGSLVACNKSERAQGNVQASASASAASAAPSQQEKDDELSEKLNAYIECLNGIGSQLLRCRRDYSRFADETKGPPTKGTPSVNLYVSAQAQCFESLAKVKPLPPPLPALEPAVAAFELSVREILPLITQVNEYYKQGNYKDDKFAKGKALHAPLVAAFAKVVAANTSLGDQVSKMNEDISARRLVALEKDPSQRIRYLVARSQKEAKILVDGAEIKDLKDLDLAKYTALVETYDKTIGELDAYTGSHKEELDKVNSYSQFADQTKTFLKAAKELMRRKRDKKDFRKEYGDPSGIEGHPAQVLDQYNRLVTAGNSLYFR